MTRRILALVVWAMPLAAQTSALQGLITDHQGAVIAAGAVPVTNLETAAAIGFCNYRQATTGSKFRTQDSEPTLKTSGYRSTPQLLSTSSWKLDQ